MGTLYELKGQMMELLDMLLDPEVDDSIVRDTLEGVEFELEEKADNYAKLMKTLEAEVDGINGELERLFERKRTRLNAIDRLKSALFGAMVDTGKTNFSTTLFSFRIQKNPATVEITGDVPKEFLIPQPDKVDKKALISFVKENGDQEYAHLTRGESLRIR